MKNWSELQSSTRAKSGLSVTELASRTGMSRPNLSAYEHGRKTPTVNSAQRIAGALGMAVDMVEPDPKFEVHFTRQRRPYVVPDRLPSLPIGKSVRAVQVPTHLHWSGNRGRIYRLVDPKDRATVYRYAIVEGEPEDILEYVDGRFLVQDWEKIILPLEIRATWQPLIDSALAAA